MKDPNIPYLRGLHSLQSNSELQLKRADCFDSLLQKRDNFTRRCISNMNAHYTIYEDSSSIKHLLRYKGYGVTKASRHDASAGLLHQRHVEVLDPAAVGRVQGVVHLVVEEWRTGKH